MRVKRTPVCKVHIYWYGDLPRQTVYQVYCLKCGRILGTFSKHESAMNWAQAHAMGSKHIRGQ